MGPFRMNEEEQSLRKARRVGNSDFAVTSIHIAHANINVLLGWMCAVF